MSASLVGSEMCIRDSDIIPFPVGFTAGASARHTSANATRCRELTPVSYTHLTLPTICSV
eukprot:5753943-Alexandrium_andersonii.AAC.1